MPAVARRLGNRAGTEGMDRIEALAPALGEDADEVDDGIGAVDGAIDRPAVADIGLDRLDPADRAERLEMAGEIRPADRGADAPAALQQRADHMTADEARAAEDRDQTLVAGETHSRSWSRAVGMRRHLYRGSRLSSRTGRACTGDPRRGSRAAPLVDKAGAALRYRAPLPRWRNW